MSNGNQGFPQRKKNALDNYAFNMSVPVPNEQNKYSNLSWEISRNSLGIKVYTGHSSDINGKQRGIIRATLSGINFYAFLELLKNALASEGAFKSKIEYKDYHFLGGRRSDTPQVISVVYVGRDEDGTIWVSVIDALNEGRPRIKFEFGNGRNHKFIHGDGTPYSRAEVSQLFARAYYNFLSTAGSYVMVREYVEPKPRNNQGGANRGNYNSNYTNNNGGNHQNNNDNTPDDSFSDDLPF